MNNWNESELFVYKSTYIEMYFNVCMAENMYWHYEKTLKYMYI